MDFMIFRYELAFLLITAIMNIQNTIKISEVTQDLEILNFIDMVQRKKDKLNDFGFHLSPFYG